MKNKFFILLLCFTLAATFANLLIYKGRKDIERSEIKYKTDTVDVYHTDTVFVYQPIVHKRIIKDTVKVVTLGQDTTYLPSVQKHYRDSSVYDLWISGVEPLNLDSIFVYNKREYRTITKEVYKKTLKLSFFGGFLASQSLIVPKVGVSLTDKKRNVYGLELGAYENKPIFGFTYGRSIELK